MPRTWTFYRFLRALFVFLGGIAPQPPNRARADRTHLFLRTIVSRMTRHRQFLRRLLRNVKNYTNIQNNSIIHNNSFYDHTKCETRFYGLLPGGMWRLHWELLNSAYTYREFDNSQSEIINVGVVELPQKHARTNFARTIRNRTRMGFCRCWFLWCENPNRIAPKVGVSRPFSVRNYTFYFGVSFTFQPRAREYVQGFFLWIV